MDNHKGHNHKGHENLLRGENFLRGNKRVLILVGILFCLLAVSCVSASNYYNYVYNGTTWVPMLSTSDGQKKLWVEMKNCSYGYVTDNLDVEDDMNVDGSTFVVDSDNNRVGIGTSTPQNKLNVEGDANITGNLNLGEKITFALGEIIDNIVDGWVRVTGGVNVTQNFSVNVDTFFVDSNNDKVGINTTSPSHELHVVGNANITGNLYLGQNLTDLAEFIFSEGDIEAADVVVISDNIKVKKSDEPYDKAVIGVISTAPAAVFGSGKGDVRLAISGRVPVKVTNENGNIEIGDLLTTSSVPGHAMKCKDIINCFGNIIGKALTPSNEKYGEVIMIVMLN